MIINVLKYKLTVAATEAHTATATNIANPSTQAVEISCSLAVAHFTIILTILAANKILKVKS